MNVLCLGSEIVGGELAAGIRDGLDREALEELDLLDAPRILLKTTNSSLWDRAEFSHDFIRLTGSGAHYLIERGAELIGIDYLSIGDEEAHHELLSSGVVAVEGLDLRGVEAGRYELICLPIRLEGSDGAPARAVLVGSR
jgi:arylformamidase